MPPNDPEWYRMKQALVGVCREMIDAGQADSRDLVINVAAGTVRDQRSGDLLHYWSRGCLEAAPAMVRGLLPWRSHVGVLA